jgi:hypothetical protein
MLQIKDIRSVGKLNKYLSNSEKMVNHLVDLLQFFEFKGVDDRLDEIKKKGFKMNNVFSIFVLLPFMHHPASLPYSNLKAKVFRMGVKMPIIGLKPERIFHGVACLCNL